MLKKHTNIRIFIQGFKSIHEGQWIALGDKLTFLVGPNSAGKSVLMHALSKLNGNTPEFDFDEALVHTNPNRNSSKSSIHSLGVEWLQSGRKISFISSYGAQNALDHANIFDYKNIHRRTAFIDENAFEEFGLFRRTAIHVDDSLVLATDLDIVPEGSYADLAKALNKWKNENNIVVDFASLGPADLPKFREMMTWSIEVYSRIQIPRSMNPDNEKLNKALDVLKSIQADYEAQGVFVWSLLNLQNVIRRRFEGIDRQKMLNRLDQYDAYVNKYKKRMQHNFGQYFPGKSLTTCVVAAERVLPLSTELECVIDMNAERRNDPMAQARLTQQGSWASTSADSSGPYRDLAASAVASTWSKEAEGGLAAMAYWDADKTLLANVNQALADDLFTDNGYQVEVQSSALISYELWSNRVKVDADCLIDTLFQCTIKLKDAHGRILRFEDVGSGIGYVLPVLIESFRETNANQVVFLQQPELHLHPALQANLADVLIEATHDRRIVTETHSEHLILRALKRIRQTTNGLLKDPNLALTPKDIAVNYFEPRPDGTTKIHVLRVTEDGDFMDRWPNGFFAERDQELFDE